MKFVTFIDLDGQETPGILIRQAGGEAVLPLAAALPQYAGASLLDFIEQHADADLAALRAAQKDAEAADAPGRAVPAADVALISPIPRPRHDILCVGVNYRSHEDEIEEASEAVKIQSHVKTIYFAKRASRIIGSGEPLLFREEIDPCLDYEVELAVVIGRGGSDIPRDEVEKHIFGYAVFNDFSSRGLQKAHTQWYRGKSLDTYTAMGPYILTADEVPMPFDLTVESRVNGEVRQHSHTALMLNDIQGIVSEFSTGITLDAGDIIATGTPGGVAMAMEPPVWLKEGDEVACEITGLGVLTNPIKKA